MNIGQNNSAKKDYSVKRDSLFERNNITERDNSVKHNNLTERDYSVKRNNLIERDYSNGQDDSSTHARSILAECGLAVPDILLPKKHIDYSKWSVIACDQYTSQPDYWRRARKIISDSPSTLDLIIPEAFLNDNFDDRITKIQESASLFIQKGVFDDPRRCFILTERTLSEGSKRYGLIVALDLEVYDYKTSSAPLVRATEATVAERLPTRYKIRQASPIDLSHILILVDDAECTLIEPIIDLARQNKLETLYDFNLMLDGGNIKGYKVDGGVIQDFAINLKKMNDADLCRHKYNCDGNSNSNGNGSGNSNGNGNGNGNGSGNGSGSGKGSGNGSGSVSGSGNSNGNGNGSGNGSDVMLFAAGDGNHSLAAAKLHWESLKSTLSSEETITHPARYALVEIVNLHSDAMVFEPIHRVLFNTTLNAVLEFASEYYGETRVSYCETGGNTSNVAGVSNVPDTLRVDDVPAVPRTHVVQNDAGVSSATDAPHTRFVQDIADASAAPDTDDSSPSVFSIPVISNGNSGVITVNEPDHVLPVAEIQAFLDAFHKSVIGRESELDYIHDEKELIRLSEEIEGCVCFFLPPINKYHLFKTVIHDGALPRKSFSLGHSNEKRYYLEGRLIKSADACSG